MPTICPIDLSPELSTDSAKQTQWPAYASGKPLEGKPQADVTAGI